MGSGVSFANRFGGVAHFGTLDLANQLALTLWMRNGFKSILDNRERIKEKNT